MGSRLELQTTFEDILGSENVYYQPPSSKQMEYPAIKFSMIDIKNSHANNSVYFQDIAYDVIVLDYDPDSEIVGRVSKLPKCKFNRHYESDNLHHTVFKLYY